MKQIYSLILFTALAFSGIVKAEDLTVGHGNTSLVGMPVYASNAANYYCSQTVYDADSLKDMKNMLITKLTYTLKAVNNNGNYENVQIRLLEVEYNTLATSTSSVAYKSIDGATLVFQGTMPASESTTIELTLSVPFLYKGGHLLVDTRKTEKGGGTAPTSSSGSIGRFTGTATPGYTTLYATTNYELPTSGKPAAYIPNIIFTYEDPTATGCAEMGTLTTSNITANSATVSWDAITDVDNYQSVCVLKGAEVDWAGITPSAATSVTPDTLKANTEYDVYVRTYCGAGEGEQGTAKKASFKTVLSCAAPTMLAIPEETITATTAVVTWHSSGKGETQWQYTYEMWFDEIPNWDAAKITDQTSVTLTGLTPTSLYQVWVRSYCGPDDQSEEITEFFATPESSATAIDNTAVKAKSTKRIENGTLIIENNGVIYNAQGARVSK